MITDGRRFAAREELWGICAYFNPLGYRRRLSNYRIFRDRIGVPLVTVEYGLGGRFELSEDDADILIRCSGDDILWQRERLLNIALSAVPTTCRKIARFDTDIVFDDDNWVDNAVAMLDDYPMVQLFSEAHDQPQDFVPGVDRFPNGSATWRSFGSLGPLSRQIETLDRRKQAQIGRSSSAMGLAWAFRRELHAELGIYDACILGGGEHALLCAACGVPEYVTDYQGMGCEWRGHYEKWAERFYGFTEGRIGAIPGAVSHLWHGEIANRGYGARYRHFREFEFSPQSDLRLNDDLAWRWKSPKTEMHSYVRNYFASRREDG